MSNISRKLSRGDIEYYYSVRAPKLFERAGGLRGPCPLHDGDRDSFHVDLETGFWHCHSTCNRGGDVVQFEMATQNLETGEAIKSLEALLDRKLSEPRPQQQRPQTPHRKLDPGSPYDYVDESGSLLFQVLRFIPKSFSQRRKAPQGAKAPWVYKLGSCDVEMADGSKRRLDAVRIVPYRLPEIARSETVVIVEGEKDVIALRSRGFVATCNPGGALNWRSDFGSYFAGKRVVIIPDQDPFDPSPAKKPETQFVGQRHGLMVAKNVLPAAASVRLVALRGAKDVSDWFDAGGTVEQLEEQIQATPELTAELLAQEEARLLILAQAKDTEEQEPENPKVDPIKRYVPSDSAAGKEPNEIAMEILASRSILADASGNVYEYNGTVWEEIAKVQLESYALERDGIETSKRRRSEVADFICTTMRQRRIPWRSVEEWEVGVRNGVLNLRDLTLRPHRKEDYLETVMPVDFRPGADCPTWKRALKDWFGDDADYDQKVLAVQEFFGYILMGHAKYKKALFLYGKGDTGKSQVLAAAIGLVGQENTTSVSVEDMDDPRRLAPIKGKMINTLSELQNDAMIADGGFKKLISTGDPIQIDQKYKEAEQYFSSCKHVIVSNVIPSINDLTSATHNRLLLVAFNRVLPKERQDPELLSTFIAEREGLLVWAVEGARRLWMNRGRFTEIPESERIVSEHRAGQNPVNDFLTEMAREAEGLTISIFELRRRFNEWINHGRYTPAKIRQMLKSAGYQLDASGNHLWDYSWK